MPKLTQYPGLRCHVRKSKRNGNVRRYWFLDHRMFGTEKDIPLGTDYEEAVRQWDEWKNHKPRIRGTLEEAFKRWEEEVLPGYDNAGTRKNYRLSLKRLREVFGQATWEATKLHHLKAYLKARSAKRQANHEMSLLSIIWNWARTEGITEVEWPAAGMKRSKWKNKEGHRRVRVAHEVFTAIYAEGDQVLKDCMDISSATGMRLTDCRQVLLPADGVLHIKASKTGKESDFDLSLSQVLPALLARRRAIKARHLMLLSTPEGKPVTYAMLRERYVEARKKAAESAAPDLAARINAMWLRDCRKYAASLTGSLSAARELLDHDSESTTAQHYFFEPTLKKPQR